MYKELIKIFYLSAMVDGKLHDQEMIMINQYKNHFIPKKELSKININNIIKEMHTLVSAGMKPKYFLEQIKKELSQNELNSLYALGVETCSINFEIVPPENAFISDMEIIWEIPQAVIKAVKRSINLRYLNNIS